MTRMETPIREREVILPATASLTPASFWLECAGARVCRRAAAGVGLGGGKSVAASALRKGWDFFEKGRGLP